MIDQIRFAIALLTLCYACRSDLKTRTVPNELWGVVFVVSLPLVLYNLVVGHEVLYLIIWKALLALTFLYSSAVMPISVLVLAIVFTAIVSTIYYVSTPITLSELNRVPIPFFVPMTAAYILLHFCEVCG